MERLIILPGDPCPPGVPAVLRCSFNPAELEFTQSASLAPRPAPLGLSGAPADLPPAFGYAGPPHATLALRLLFEARQDPVSGAVEDVRAQTRPLYALAGRAGPGQDRPCPVELVWGKHWSMTGAISRLSELLDAFTPAGAATRSWVQMELWALAPLSRPQVLTGDRIGIRP